MKKPQDSSRGWLRTQQGLARGTTLPMVALGLANTAAAILQAWCVARLIGPALLARPVADPLLWAGLFAVAAVLRAALSVLMDGRAFEAGALARRRLRTGYMVAAFAAGPHAVQAGPAVTAAVDQVDALEGFFARWLPASILAWAAPALVLAAVLAADPLAGAVMAAGGAVVPFGMALAGMGAAAASHQQFAAMARLQTRFLDRVRGIATIVLAGQAEAEALKLQSAARDLSHRTMRVLRVAFLSSAVLDTAAATVLVVLAVRAGLAWRAGALHPIAVVFTLVLVSEFFAPLRAFSAAYQDRLHATTAAATLGAMPSAAIPAAPAPAIRTVAASGVTVAFEKVVYTWDPARGPALDGLSFRVPANETAVLVGPSGAGKSTVFELLLGFVAPQSGRITINGADLASITPAALSRMTAWIGQRPVLFAGSIRDNIRFGREDAGDAAIEDAVRAAGLDAVAAALPQGLDTPIGEGGYGLSGGQAQRVAIARAFIRNAPLLLMDEPTAHLDPATEADVLDSLRRLALGRTVIMAAHSSAAMAFGGRRIVLDAGHEAAVQGVA
jgi:ATP-binding cassette subfamily C protein CydD